MGFEPTEPFGSRALQARALGQTTLPLHGDGRVFARPTGDYSMRGLRVLPRRYQPSVQPATPTTAPQAQLSLGLPAVAGDDRAEDVPGPKEKPMRATLPRADDDQIPPRKTTHNRPSVAER